MQLIHDTTAVRANGSRECQQVREGAGITGIGATVGEVGEGPSMRHRAEPLDRKLIIAETETPPIVFA